MTGYEETYTEHLRSAILRLLAREGRGLLCGAGLVFTRVVLVVSLVADQLAGVDVAQHGDGHALGARRRHDRYQHHDQW